MLVAWRPRTARTRAAAVRDDVAAETVRRVRALDDGAQLRITDAGLLARRAHRAGADADLDDVGARKQKLFGHLAGDHVAGDDGRRGELGAHAFDVLHKELAVAVGNVW